MEIGASAEWDFEIFEVAYIPIIYMTTWMFGSMPSKIRNSMLREYHSYSYGEKLVQASVEQNSNRLGDRESEAISEHR